MTRRVHPFRPMPSLVIGLGVWAALAGQVRGDDAGPTPAPIERTHPIERPDRAGAATHQPGGAWWFSLMAIGGALAAFAAFTWASRRRHGGPGGPTMREIQVLGRLPLGPRHAIYTVRVGARTLLVGTGSQGPPALLTELDDWLDGPIDEARAPSPARLVDRRPPTTVRVGSPARAMTPTGGG